MNIKYMLAGSLLCAGVLFLGAFYAQAAGPVFEHVMDIGSDGTAEGQFKYIEDFAIDNKGHLLATDAAHTYVQVFDKVTGKFITRFGGKTSEDYDFEKPEGISASPDGRIFIADYIASVIIVFNADYEKIAVFGEYGTGPGQMIKPELTDIYNNLYYVPEAGNQRVSVWDLDGNFKFSFGKYGSGAGEFNIPEAIKFNSEGLAFVTDLKNDRVQVFTAQGQYIKTIGRSGSRPGEFNNPTGLGIDKDDNLYIGDGGNDRIQVLDKNGNFAALWGSKGNGPGQFGNIHGVLVDKSTGWIYIADTANNRIQVYKPAYK